MDEDASNPRRHGVRLRWTKVNVEHHNSHADTNDACNNMIESQTASSKQKAAALRGWRWQAAIYQLTCHLDLPIYLNVSRIMVNKTNLPSRGTTKLVGGIISANSRKNTVSDSKIDMARLTLIVDNIKISSFQFSTLLYSTLLFKKKITLLSLPSLRASRKREQSRK